MRLRVVSRCARGNLQCKSLRLHRRAESRPRPLAGFWSESGDGWASDGTGPVGRDFPPRGLTGRGPGVRRTSCVARASPGLPAPRPWGRGWLRPSVGWPPWHRLSCCPTLPWWRIALARFTARASTPPRLAPRPGRCRRTRARDRRPPTTTATSTSTACAAGRAASGLCPRRPPAMVRWCQPFLPRARWLPSSTRRPPSRSGRSLRSILPRRSR